MVLLIACYVFSQGGRFGGYEPTRWGKKLRRAQTCGYCKYTSVHAFRSNIESWRLSTDQIIAVCHVCSWHCDVKLLPEIDMKNNILRYPLLSL